MLVVVPAVPSMLHPSVVPAILEAGYAPIVVPMLELQSYWHLVRDLWAAAETFAIVEHDIEVSAGELGSLDACPERWCAYSYEVYAGDLAGAYGGAWGLGCSRFRRELLLELPDVVEAAGEMEIPDPYDNPINRARSWGTVDYGVSHTLRVHGLEVHQHQPNVAHHHHYDRENAYVPPLSAADGAA